jgi:hypothetical protein
VGRVASPSHRPFWTLDSGGVATLDPAVLDRLRERLAARPEILEAYYFGSQATVSWPGA